MSEVNPRPIWFLKCATVWTRDHELKRAALYGQFVLSRGILEADTR